MNGVAWERKNNALHLKSKKGDNMNRIDTSIQGYKYIGIKLTEQQFKDLNDLEILVGMNEHRQKIPVFNTMAVLKVLGLLPPEMIYDVSHDNANNNSNENINEALQRKFGKVID